MSTMKYVVYRCRQSIFCKVQNLLPWRNPEVISGKGSLLKVPMQVKKDGITKIQVITTAGFIKRGSLKELFNKLSANGISYHIFDGVHPDPTIECIEAAVKEYRKAGCEGIIAVGGGSVIDCAKIVGARIVSPNKSISDMAGMLKIRKNIPPLYAVPTTAGTGSETTVAAVVTDSKDHRKYAISDLCLMPKYAVLDPEITCNLPSNLTAMTGMDALTHAVEAYTNKYNLEESRKYALKATSMIFHNLKKAYDNGQDIQVRDNMLKASYYAGAAFTKAYVGYVHAIAHAVGGIYGIPHGLANAVILPIVLENFGEAVYGRLSELADAVGISGTSIEEKAHNFIKAIREMNTYMNIPCRLEQIRDEDIAQIVNRAIKESNPAYPVPDIWDREKFTNVVKMIQGK